MTLVDGTELTPALGVGALAEKALVHEGQCTRVDSAAPIRPSPRFWAVMCMTGIGAAINTGAITFADAVAVIGCGGVVGGGAVAGAVLAGAQTIIAVDIDTTNLDWPANSAPPTPSMPATSIRSQPSKN